MFGAIFGNFRASPGPGVVGNGFSAKNDSQLRGRDSNPSPGDPFRGHFSFLKVSPPKIAKVYVYVFCFSRDLASDNPTKSGSTVLSGNVGQAKYLPRRPNRRLLESAVDFQRIYVIDGEQTRLCTPAIPLVNPPSSFCK